MKKEILIIILLFILPLIIIPVYAQEENNFNVSTYQVDAIIYYKHEDGWWVKCLDGYQVTGRLHVTIYVNKPGKISVTAMVENEKIFDVNQAIDFKADYDVNIPSSKYGKTVTFTIIATWGRVSKTIIKSYTVVEKPIGPKVPIVNLTEKQVNKLLENVTWESITKAVFASIGGIGIAVFLKYYLKMLDPINAMQIPMLIIATIVIFLVEPDYGAGYFMILTIADLLSYRFMKGPQLLGILHLKMRKREAWDAELPIYTTEDGRLAVALQRSDYAIRRLLGRHVYVEFTGPVKPYFWRKNGEMDLIFVDDARLRKKTLEFTLPSEQGELKETEKRQAYVMELHIASANTVGYLRNVDMFLELKDKYLECEDERMRLVNQVDLMAHEGGVKAIMNWARLRGGENVSGEE